MNPIDIPRLNQWLAEQNAPGRIAVRQVVIEDDLFARLTALLTAAGAGRRPVCVMMDYTPMWRLGQDAKLQFLEILGTVCQPQVIRLGTPARPPHADLQIAEDLAGALPSGCLLISFGSGTVTDLAKHARFLAQGDHSLIAGLSGNTDKGRTFVSLPTACTVTAFSSALAVLGVAGVKRTIPSRNPDEVWIDRNLLADAPRDLTRAGVGDLLARGVAYADWHLSGLLGIDESYTDVPRRLLADHEARLPEIAKALVAGDRGAYGDLMEALLLAGYAMSVVGTTTPISGWEHVMSHYLDLVNGTLQRPLNLHGVQVAAGAFVATRAYRAFLAEATADNLRAAADVDLAARAAGQIAEHFASIDPEGTVRKELLRDYLPKASRWSQAAGRLRDLAEQWPGGHVQQQLTARLMPLDRLETIAETMGLPRCLTGLESLPSPKAPADCVRHCHLVRQRFTLGDLLGAMGWLQEDRIAGWLQPD